MVRPASIVWFDRCLFGSIALWLVGTALNWNAILVGMAANPATEQFGPSFVPTVAVLSVLVILGVWILLWYFAARRVSVLAKWIITIFFVLILLGLGFAAVAQRFPDGLSGVVRIVTFVLFGVGVWQLFRPDAEAWFARATATDVLPRR